MEEADPYGLCALRPHPTHIPHYITPRDGLPALCALSEQLSRQQGLGWAGMPKAKPKKAIARKRTPRKSTRPVRRTARKEKAS